ncbi:hypothetical protein B7R21_06400 [Subtercola boreus]|uniref:Uncharacterized protein n=1 Tax=Subtercola boreus TaxID=120213 RepID=A0A3E0VWY0_9MICO|nr:hypothetical protein [Subtercola boreus]RFA14572.1 hypothetical protein B7R21_06400 [Subtercola boreus]
MRATIAELAEASDILRRCGLIGDDQATSLVIAMRAVAPNTTYREWVEQLVATPGTNEQQYLAWAKQYGNDAVRVASALAHEYSMKEQP